MIDTFVFMMIDTVRTYNKAPEASIKLLLKKRYHLGHHNNQQNLVSIQCTSSGPKYELVPTTTRCQHQGQWVRWPLFLVKTITSICGSCLTISASSQVEDLDHSGSPSPQPLTHSAKSCYRDILNSALVLNDIHEIEWSGSYQREASPEVCD